MMKADLPTAPRQVLVLFDSSDEELRARVRRLVRQNAPGAVRCVSLWDLRRADDVPVFDRREILGRLRIEMPEGAAIEGPQAEAWMDARSARPEPAVLELIAA